VGNALVSVGLGSHRAGDGTVRLGTRLGEGTHVTLTADTSRNSGYDNLSVPGGDRDSSFIRRGSLRSRTTIDSHNSLELLGSHVQGVKQVATAGDPNQQSYPDITQRSSNLAGRWTTTLSASHELQVRALAMSSSTRQDWRTCTWAFMLNQDVVDVVNNHPELAAAVSHGGDARTLLLTNSQLAALLSPAEVTRLLGALAAMGGTQGALQNTCGLTNNNMDESRSQIELQDTLVVNDRLRLVTGAGLRRQSATSDTLFTGTVNSTVRWLYGNGEYRALPSLTLNAGGYYESNSLSGNSFSPRAAANYHFSDSQTIRLVYSKGSRSPDALEVRGNWAPTVDQITPPLQGTITSARTFALLRGNPGLVEERNTSLELGHVLALRNWGMVIDSRVFKDRLTDLITNYSTYYQLTPNNDTSLKLAGAETQVNWDQGGDWSGWLHYAYLVNYAASNQVEQTQWSRHSGGVGVSRRINDHWLAALSTVHSSAEGFRQSRYGRTDLTVTHQLRLDGKDIATSLTASYMHTPTITTYMGWQSGSVQSSYNDRLGLYAKVRVGF
jgi:iron complex outermembrane receptor protein